MQLPLKRWYLFFIKEQKYIIVSRNFGKQSISIYVNNISSTRVEWGVI